MKNIFHKIQQNELLTKEDAKRLLEIPLYSKHYYKLIDLSMARSRRVFQKGYVFVQIGLDRKKCPGNCAFCTFAEDNYDDSGSYCLKYHEIDAILESMPLEKISAIFLMTTMDYPKSEYLDVVQNIRNKIPKSIALVANIGDFDLDFAFSLKQAGISAVYHILRLREGIDTNITRETRLKTLDAIKKSGMDLYYCIEPIGMEHTSEELIEQMEIARKYAVDVMAIMARVSVAGTRYEAIEEVSSSYLLKVAAVCNLYVQPRISMNVHEPDKMVMLAGINQLYAEIGGNPRDIEKFTENRRGYSIDQVENLLSQFDFKIS